MRVTNAQNKLNIDEKKAARVFFLLGVLSWMYIYLFQIQLRPHEYMIKTDVDVLVLD